MLSASAEAHEIFDTPFTAADFAAIDAAEAEYRQQKLRLAEMPQPAADHSIKAADKSEIRLEAHQPAAPVTSAAGLLRVAYPPAEILPPRHLFGQAAAVQFSEDASTSGHSLLERADRTQQAQAEQQHSENAAAAVAASPAEEPVLHNTPGNTG